jgi:hypothetical protein
MSWSLWTNWLWYYYAQHNQKAHAHTNKSSTTLLKQNQKNGILSARLIESPETHAKASNPNPVLQSSSSSFFTGSSGTERRSSLTSWIVFFRFSCPFQASASFQRQGGGDKDKSQKKARESGRRGNRLIEGKRQKRDKTQFHRDLENVVRAITEEEQEEDAEAHHAYLL